jgi:hypothetical protein
MINEGNKQDQYLEKKGESIKTTAMRKASSRRGRFSGGDTHQDFERETITWARPGTRPYADSLDRQRKSAHRGERGKKKPQAGSSPEDRRWAEFSGDKPEGKYEKLQKAKKRGERTNIEAQKQGLVRKGEKRRQLRTQAVDAIRKAMGGGYVSEAKVDNYQKLSPIEKEFVRHKRQTGFEPGSDIDKHTETRRLVHREKRGAKKRESYRDESSRLSGKYASKSQNQKKLKELQGKKTLRSASNNIRDFERSTKTFEEFINEARRMRVLRTAHYTTASNKSEIMRSGFRDSPSTGSYHPDERKDIVYTTPSSRVGSDYSHSRVNLRLVNPKVTSTDSPRDFGKKIKSWMSSASDDDIADKKGKPTSASDQAKSAFKQGAKVVRVPNAHGGFTPREGQPEGSYIMIDKETANKSIDRNPSTTFRAKGKTKRSKTQPKKRQ